MPNRVIDAHQHFWNLGTGTYPWMASDEMKPLRRDYGPAELMPLMAGSGVDATILVQCRHELEETRDFLAIADKYSFVAGVVGWVDLQAEDVAEQLTALRLLPGGKRLVGIRHNVHDEPDADWLRRPAVRRGIAAVFDADLTFDLLVRTRELPAAIELVSHLREGRFVLDHMAKPSIAPDISTLWENAFRELARFGNVWCKISGLVTEADWSHWAPADFDPYMQIALDCFGPDRLIFGSDWPVSTLAASYSDVKSIATRLTAAAPSFADRFFERNAIDAYHLSTERNF
ncbi:amidohydrolase [Rhizobium ruizarguesonis]|nr:amidohydrolase family protein [Rhizobium ruizarguesonis]MBY5851615.1 amidohydrolase family protein [Rhizobium leguminosarum]NKL13378.1 amidohydrolase family protein [Rhizobium leguminosarum bv. viciae]MBY5873382.1 amidohydrolase family protein [Rhizobium leguminosarum]MBY5892400.1 amidohydrolase family protein [Rhizobium leguminosarum]NEH38259.1 amidohydrolase family protein [Rhizobium ruizarguesonis]